MSADILNFPNAFIGGVNDPTEWGGCPKCHRNDGYVDVECPDGVEQWFTCRRHKIKWSVGVNVFSGIKYFLETEPEKTQKILIKNQMRLERYQTVKPWYPDNPS